MFFYWMCVFSACLLFWKADAHRLRPRANSTPVEEQIWDYNTNKVRGVSLGGWFVLEPYITPSLFEAFGSNESKIPVDEYTFCQQLGREEAKRRLEKHWSEYYTEQDFIDIKNLGLNLVRIPVGYWAFQLLDNDPYVQGQEKYIDQSIQWAKNQGLKVWFDLHGVPGSQNGFDNSGKRGTIGWQHSETNLEVTQNTLDYIFGKYGQEQFQDTVIGIEIVNEPMMSSLNVTGVLQFTYDSYDRFRNKYNSQNWFLVQEGFMSIGYWNEHLNNDFQNVSRKYTSKNGLYNTTVLDFHGVVIDHHHYEVFTTGQLAKSSEERINDIRNYAKAVELEQSYHPSLIGEWSGAITDCAKWLNGVGTGARYDGTFSSDQLLRSGNQSISRLRRRDDATKSCSNVATYKHMSQSHKDEIRKFNEIQLISYEANTAGWIFWNYKTEDAIEWDLRGLIDKKMFPHPFDDFKYFTKVDGEFVAKNGATADSAPWTAFPLLAVSVLAMTVFGCFV